MFSKEARVIAASFDRISDSDGAAAPINALEQKEKLFALAVGAEDVSLPV